MAKAKFAEIKESVSSSHYAGIFFVSLATLLLEFSLTRVLSVSLWYHFAFMVISVALLGFGISGVILSLSKTLSSMSVDKLLTFLSILFGISVMVSFYLMNLIPFDPFSLLIEPEQFLYLPLYYILITLPFIFPVLIISVLLTRFKRNVPKLYFFDLTGAGLACVFFVLLIPVAGGNGMIIFVSAFAFLSAIIFSFKSAQKYAMLSFILMALGFSYMIDKDVRFPINVTANKLYGKFIADRPDLKILSEWNTISKIDVMIDEDKPVDGYQLYSAIIDAGNATTNIPNLKTLPPPTRPADASNLAFTIKDSASKVFIIGSAGGGEILTSLYRNAKDITAVEINGILNDLIESKLLYWTGPLVKNNKKVKLITDDARSVLKRGGEKYDAIISAHTISASAVSSGAMSMVENFILTKESVKEFLNHLKDDGVLYISRPETQVPKIITTLRKAGEEITGSDKFRKSFIIFRRPPTDFEGSMSFLAGVLFCKNGFDDFDIVKIKNEAGSLGLEILYDNMSQQESPLKNLILKDNIDEEIRNFGKNINPATDDKPFFDNNIGFGGLTFAGIKETFSQGENAIYALKDRPVAETMLIVLLLQIIIIAGLLIILPLKFIKKDDGSPMRKINLLYFAGIGLGYIMIQIAMVQKFTLILGQPVYTMLTVISTMLVSSGIGSMFSEKFFKNSPNRLVIIFSIISGLALLIGLFNQEVYNIFGSADMIIRIFISMVLVAPLGFFMGMPFPIGFGLIGENEKRFSSFAWAVNGFFSVIGTVIAIILAMMLGYKVVFIAAALLYLASMLIAQRWVKA